jgi:hypothetical protein
MGKRKAPTCGAERHVRIRSGFDFVNQILEKMDAVSETLSSQGRTFVSYMQELLGGVCALCCVSCT